MISLLPEFCGNYLLHKYVKFNLLLFPMVFCCRHRNVNCFTAALKHFKELKCMLYEWLVLFVFEGI